MNMSVQSNHLLNVCVEVVDTFQPHIHSAEDHITSFLLNHRELHDSDCNFITEVFSGCVRYNSVMSVVTNGFYARDGEKMLRSEENLYKVVCYICVFRLAELGMEHFRRLIFSQDVKKMYRFLNFFLDEKNLLTWIKDEWNKYYETRFIETALMSPLCGWLGELQEMLLQMKRRIQNKNGPRKKPVSVTQPKPFNLTKPEPRAIPVPEPIPKLQSIRPVPVETYNEPAEFYAIASAKVENRRRAEKQLMDSNRVQFACAYAEKSEKAKQRQNTIMAEKEQQLAFDQHKANPVPSFLMKEVPVKLNTAAILREGKLYKERQEEEIKRLINLQSGVRDSTDFLKWQSEMRQKDFDAELLDIETRRLKGKISHEEAIQAKKNITEENKQKAASLKQETQQIMQEHLEQRFKQELEMRQLVEDTIKGHKNAKESKTKLQAYKQKIVREVTEDKKELMKQALENAEAEMRRKLELIHQIKAMEAVPIIRHKFVDLTETSGAGFLNEMSIAELGERLTLLKIAREEEEETKRDEILAAKEARNQNLIDTLEMISKHRQVQSKEAAARTQQKKNAHLSPTGVKVKDDKLIELEKVLAEKKNKRRTEQQRGKACADVTSRPHLLRTRNQNTQKTWKELELSQEKSTKLHAQGVVGSRGAGKLAAVGV